VSGEPPDLGDRPPELTRVVERLWPGRAGRIEVLGGGITNRNYRVQVGGEAFVVRIAGQDTELLGIDRHVEEAASRLAASLGIAPEVVAFVEPEGYLVTRFIEGEPVSPERMRTPEVIDQVTLAIRSFHAGPPIPGRFSPHRLVESYLETAVARGVAIPAEFDRAKEIADRIESVRGRPPAVPCHNDLLNPNFIDDGVRVRIVDWEYAGMGDRFFDLGNFSMKHEFGDEQDQRLLETYFGTLREEELAPLRLMRFMSSFWEAMWGVVQQGISKLDFDFRGYASHHFERALAAAADPQFGRYLHVAARPT
jgi:thiamine kinase-like enzyme